MTARGPTDYPAAPRFARLLLALRVPAAEREFVKGDLDQGFAAECAARGVWRARLWYWSQLVSVLTTSWGEHAANQGGSGTSERRVFRMRGLISDARFAFRSLRRAPFFSLLVVLTLTVGIGATTAVYSVVRSLLLVPPPYPRPERLVMLWERGTDGSKSNLGYPTGVDIRRDTSAVQSLGMMSYWSPVVNAGGEARKLQGLRVTHEYFATLGVRPAMGTDFTAAEDTPDTRRVVILSHALWLSQFGGDSAAVGSSTSINGVSYRVAGVMPASFRDVITPQTDIWSPLGYDATLSWACRSCRHLRVVARLRDGITREDALQRIDADMRGMREQYPDEYGSVGALLPTLQQDLSGSVRAPMSGLSVAVVLLLLLACANVANLFLGRAGDRQTELAIRLALGADRSRLVRLVTLEAVGLAVVGGVLGVMAAWLGVRWLIASGGAGGETITQAAVSLPVVVFALVATLLSALVGGTLPAILAVRDTALSDIRVGTRALIGRVRHRMRSAVVVAEVALAVALLAAAGLQVRSLRNTLAVDTGYKPAGLLTMGIALRGERYDADGATRNYYRELLQRGSALPGVSGIALVSQLPLGGNFDSYGIHREDAREENPAEAPNAQRFAVSSNYLDVMQIRVLRGRGFDEADREGSAAVVLLNQSGARRIFGDEDALQKRVHFGDPDSPWRTVVGIVEDVRHLSLEGDVESQMYLPFDQNSFEESDLSLVVRTAADPLQLERPVVALARQLDPGTAVSAVTDMEALVESVAAPRRLALSLVGGFALIALVLAFGGLYGVMSASVAERVREMGLRSALGATPLNQMGMVLRRGLLLSLTGAALGVCGFVVASRLVARFIFGVSATDPLTIGAVTLLIAAIALLACLWPATRAARVEPMVALRD